MHRLHRAWREREPVVVRLACDPAEWRDAPSLAAEPWSLSTRLEIPEDRLHFLLWANNYDARDGRTPTWWWAHKAERLGATIVDDGSGDVVLPSGATAWIDGGPRARLDLGDDVAVVHRETVDRDRLDPEPTSTPQVPSELAADQAAAVDHDGGPARILAPAGSGKTRVMVERLRMIDARHPAAAGTTVAVAYNRRAQREIRERAPEARARIDTLNALGYEVVGRALGQRPPVATERQCRRLLEALVAIPRRRANTDPLAPYVEALSLARLGLRKPQDIEDERDDIPGFAEAFVPYREELRRRGVVDFDEQIYGAIEFLLRNGAFRREQQALHRRLLVDEFQDLTPAHLLLIRLLALPELDVFGVGDDDQVIYGHAGADPGFLIDFGDWFPGAADHRLVVNHRCPAEVIAASQLLLRNNQRRVGKDVEPAPGRGPDPDSIELRAAPADRMAAELVDLITGWLGQEVAANEIAVLARVNALLLAPQVALQDAGVPVSSALSPHVLGRTGVRAALAYLRIATAASGFDGGDVREVLRRPSRGFPNWIEKWFPDRRMGIEEFGRIADRLDDDRVAQKVRDLGRDLEAVIQAAASGTTREVLQVIRDVVDLQGAMELLDASGGAQASHLDDLDALAQVADLHPDPSGFEAWLRDMLDRPGEEAGVVLSTVHRVKGQEWDAVAVFGVSEGILPHRLADDVEEERRVLHVALTRCRNRVVALSDAGRPSPFLAELRGARPAPPKPVSSRRPRVSQNRRSDVPDAPSEVLDGLKRWRADRARRDGVPAYVVMHDRHLASIGARMPMTAAELARCDGMGPTRMERYADEILAALAELR